MTGPVTVKDGLSSQERKYYIILKENIDTVHDLFSKHRVLQYSKYYQLLQNNSHSTFYMLEVIACDVAIRLWSLLMKSTMFSVILQKLLLIPVSISGLKHLVFQISYYQESLSLCGLDLIKHTLRTIHLVSKM